MCRNGSAPRVPRRRLPLTGGTLQFGSLSIRGLICLFWVAQQTLAGFGPKFALMPHGALPWHVVAAFDDVDAAVSSALRFISEVAKQHASLFGAEGESAGMHRVVDAMVVCFDWEHLVATRPTPLMGREFGPCISC